MADLRRQAKADVQEIFVCELGIYPSCLYHTYNRIKGILEKKVGFKATAEMSIGAADESVCGGVEITQRTVLITDRAATTTHISDCLGQ